MIDSSPSEFSVESSYRAIESCHTKKMFLDKNAMTELRSHLSFTQLRFYCRKQQQGRTFHVTTVANSTGDAVVQYFSGQTDVRPDACGSFLRMDDDNSRLTRMCDKWGYNSGRWGISSADESRLYNHAAFVKDNYHWMLRSTESGLRWECDDKFSEVSTGDFWKVFVR